MNDKLVRTRIDGVDVHDYNDIPVIKNFKGAKRRFRRYMDKKYPGQPIRMSEWTEMRGGRDFGMESALALANEAFEDLSIMRVVSWQLWIAVSEYDYCDGLIYIDAEKPGFELPKRYYAFGQFTKFIPRGAVHIGVDGVPEGLQALAFDCGTHTAVILTNPAEQDMQLSLGDGTAALYETNEAKSLEKSEIALNAFSIGPRSVNTVVIPAA